MRRTTSLYLDAVRWFAASIVLLSHVSYGGLTGGQLQFLSGFGIQAVDIFFVLSGFVVAHTYVTRETGPRSYAVNRAVRIYSVALPAIILTVLFDRLGLMQNPAVYADDPYQPLNLGLVLRTVLFLGESWNAHRFPGSDGPYWSLSFEVWYYVGFGVFVFFPARWRWVGAAAVAAIVGPKIALMFPVWLMGVATYRLCGRRRITRRLGWFLLVAPLPAYMALQCVTIAGPQPFMPLAGWASMMSIGHNYILGALFSIHLLGFNTVSDAFTSGLERIAKPIRWIAGTTFSIYLVHLPTMFLLAAISPFARGSAANAGFLVAGAVATCLVFAALFERPKDFWRRACLIMLTQLCPHQRLVFAWNARAGIYAALSSPRATALARRQMAGAPAFVPAGI
jgi:peptidoglycan/LPS O-acetylase OafA/YrhL